METGLTFDDILLVPRRTSVDPDKADTSSQITPNITLQKPIISAPMDKVTEHEMAISMARQGGLGVIHRNIGAEQQAEEVAKVKRSESWIIKNPETIPPNIPLRQIKQIMNKKDISGLPVVKNGELRGIITKRDTRFEENLDKEAEELMTKDVVKATPETDMEEAKTILHENRIEKLPLVDENNELKGLITLRDIEKKKKHPEATLDKEGQLIVGAAVGPDQFKRAEKLADAGANLIVIDTAHGNSEDVINATEQISSSLDVEVMSGNVATEEGARSLIEAGADTIRVGVGPGSICTTRIVSGVGVPQITATRETVKAAEDTGATIVTDGGIRYSGDIAKALACGADAVMLGSLLAGTEESPGEVVFKGGRKYKEYRGMGSISAMEKRKKNRYNQNPEKREKYVPEGVEGVVPYKGKVEEVLHQLIGGVKSSMGHLGARTIDEMRKAKIYELTEGGKRKSHAHNVRITRENPNYSLRR